MTRRLDSMFRLPGFRGKSTSPPSRVTGALGRRPSHLHQPFQSLALSFIPMGSSEFPRVLTGRSAWAHLRVSQGAADRQQLGDPAWPRAPGPLPHRPLQHDHSLCPRSLIGASSEEREKESAGSLPGFLANEERPAVGTAAVRSNRG